MNRCTAARLATRIVTLVVAAALALPAVGQDTALAADPAPVLEPVAAAGITLADFLWQRRPIVVFADSPDDPAFRTQLQLLAADPAELIRRDVIILTDSDPAAASEVRKKLRPRGFSMVLLDKDGGVKLRKPLPWSVREIVRAIDNFPLRQEEIRIERTRN